MSPYPRTPMTRAFRERGLIVSDDLEEYDGTTAVVKTEHLSAEEVEAGFGRGGVFIGADAVAADVGGGKAV